ncbi:hypothetical protein SAMD00023353_10900120 [Rosellinia necatrix]|uniref:Uncharacterized protein n=1 Tax=Rosellinia necatrix TaxID=77044 RepID=A0A1S8ABD2_ROSNE|nr:hypothetical protein SAMD00023353_10900120 [Rosellinia necatrix]
MQPSRVHKGLPPFPFVSRWASGCGRGVTIGSAVDWLLPSDPQVADYRTKIGPAETMLGQTCTTTRRSRIVYEELIRSRAPRPSRLGKPIKP